MVFLIDSITVNLIVLVTLTSAIGTTVYSSLSLFNMEELQTILSLVLLIQDITYCVFFLGNACNITMGSNQFEKNVN